jgi:hypothetical protein
LSSSINDRIIVPGRSQVQAAEALENPRRLIGKWPYQWLFPGPNSRHVLVNDRASVPLGASSQVTLAKFQVEDGLRFSLRGIVFAFEGTGWNEGTTSGLSFTLVADLAGPMNVDFLQNVLTQLGSTAQPYPILGRLEFEPLTNLSVVVTNVGGVVAEGPPNTVVAHLVGHTYPNSEVTG